MSAKRTVRNVVLIVLGLAILGGLLAFLRKGSSAKAAAAAAASSAMADRVVPVGTATVEKRDVPVILEGLGTVTPIAMVTVKSQVDGRLDKVLFKEGQDVKKGDVLALIDSRPFAIQQKQAEANLARDMATLKNGQLNAQRYESLGQQKLIPQQQVDDQTALVLTNEAAVKADEAAIASAKLNLDYARITAPFAGVTGVRQIDPGNLIRAADTTGIVVITQIDPIAIVFTLPQDDLPQVAKYMGQGKLTVDAYSRDGSQKLASGELALVDNQINAQSSTIKLKATFANPTRVLWPNAFVKARLALTTTRDATVIPSPVVQRGPQGTFAYLIGQDSRVAMRPIEVDTTDSTWAIVTKGLVPGDHVVVDGQNQLKPGSKVAPRAPDAPKGGGKEAAKTEAEVNGAGAADARPRAATGAPRP